MARMREIYRSKVSSALVERFNYKCSMAVPKMEKIVISMGIGKAVQDKKFLDSALQDLTMIAGQKPLICAAKKKRIEL